MRRKPVTVADVETLLSELAAMARQEPAPCVDELLEDCEQDWSPRTGPRRKMTRSRRRAKRHRATTKGLGILSRCESSGKVQYRDHDEAVIALHHAKAARARAEADGAETTMFAVRTYDCPDCGFWHITKAADVTVIAIRTQAAEQELARQRAAALRPLIAASEPLRGAEDIPA